MFLLRHKIYMIRCKNSNCFHSGVDVSRERCRDIYREIEEIYRDVKKGENKATVSNSKMSDYLGGGRRRCWNQNTSPRKYEETNLLNFLKVLPN